jgi:hypothetical protein
MMFPNVDDALAYITEHSPRFSIGRTPPERPYQSPQYHIMLRLDGQEYLCQHPIFTEAVDLAVRKLSSWILEGNQPVKSLPLKKSYD